MDIAFWVSVRHNRSQRAQRSLETCPRSQHEKSWLKCECKPNSQAEPTAGASAVILPHLGFSNTFVKMSKGAAAARTHENFEKCKAVCVGHTWLIVPISLCPSPGILQEGDEAWNHPP